MEKETVFTEQLTHFKNISKEFDFQDWIMNRYSPLDLDEFITSLYSSNVKGYTVSTPLMRPVRELHVN